MKSGSLHKEQNLLAYFLLGPWLFGFFLLFLIPMLSSLYFSFTSFNMLSPPRFIGAANYVRLVNDPDFWLSLKITFSYVLMVVPLRLVVALVIALLLSIPSKSSGIYRTIFYIPSVIGGSVAVSIIWKQIFGNPGVIMTWLNQIGIPMKTSLLGNENTALLVIVLMGIWQFGSSMLIFLAALKQISRTFYDAALIEGANPVQRFLKITLPIITPTIFFNLMLQIINGFKVFNEGYIITEGGPNKATLFYVLNLYNRAFRYLDMGYSSALAWILVVIIALISAFIFKTQNKWVFYEQKEGK
ncbi:sugar ABC transporter permease [Sphaerochaeta sp. UBA5849]|uniref:carbohydrate ABC transporter permease n=1 Tax=Sphaerochaeta sp. UBA5849 TaxID=1947475 RepID=UPI0031F47F2F